MVYFVDQIHLHKHQTIMSPQWLGARLRLYLKILLGHIVCVDLCFVRPQIVSPHLQAMHYGKEVLCHELVVFFDNHQTSCSHIQWPSLFHQQSAIGKSLLSVCTLKGLSHSANFNTGGEENSAPQRLGGKAHLTLGIAISCTSRTRFDKHWA